MYEGLSNEAILSMVRGRREKYLELGISLFTSNLLARSELTFNNVVDLAHERELVKIPRIGRARASEVQQALLEAGYVEVGSDYANYHK